MKEYRAGIRRPDIVSVVIPVYNGGNYLAEAVESALSQTYDRLEVIVVNDGSCDGGITERTARSFGERVRYYEKENGGVASALNLGISQMKGEYFSWLSHDDLYCPYKVEAEIEALRQCGDPKKLIQAEYEFFQMPSGACTATDFHSYYSLEQLTNSFFSVLGLQIHACSALIHRSHFDRVGMFDEGIRTVQDIEMWFRLFRNQRSLFLPKVLHKVREHKEAGSNTISCYYEETGKIYLKMIETMDYGEMAEVFGSAGAFLCRMAGFLKSYGRDQELQQVRELLKKAPAAGRDGYGQNFERLREYLRRAAGGADKAIAIFGAGQYGLRIKYELASRLVKADYFIDNDPNKWGKVIDGIPCVSMEEAACRKDDTLVIIAQRNLIPASLQLQERGFPYSLSKQRLEAEVLKTFPAMEQMDRWL